MLVKLLCCMLTLEKCFISLYNFLISFSVLQIFEAISKTVFGGGRFNTFHQILKFTGKHKLVFCHC